MVTAKKKTKPTLKLLDTCGSENRKDPRPLNHIKSGIVPVNEKESRRMVNSEDGDKPRDGKNTQKYPPCRGKGHIFDSTP